MKFGTFHLYSQPPWFTEQEMISQELEQARWLEDLGFDEAWLAEHNARVYGIVGSLQITAAALAATTKRIRIGAAVTRLPLHHPLHTAEDLALVDVLSNGRFDWGFGKGYDPLEFETYGVDFEEREGRWEEALDIVLRAWRDGRIAHKGKFWTIPETELFPEADPAAAPAGLHHGDAERRLGGLRGQAPLSDHLRPGARLGRRQAQGRSVPQDGAGGGPRARRDRARDGPLRPAEAGARRGDARSRHATSTRRA